MRRRPAIKAAAALGLVLCLACGGGGGGSGHSSVSLGAPAGGEICTGACPQQILSVADVETVIRLGVAEAKLLGESVTLAVLDRVGNVLAVYQMPGAPPTTTITSNRGVSTGLENLSVASTLAAISKAGTAAYLSSQGNAFTTRTANQITQQHFNPGENGRPGGPLFGVQFSQLPCGDFVRRLADARRGPKRMPLGLAADPGGLPLYKEGALIGGVGVEFDGEYSADPNIIDVDVNLEERIASAAALRFSAPSQVRAENILVDGRSFRFADDQNTAFETIEPFDPSGLVAVTDFFAGAVVAGVEFLTMDSGFVATSVLVPELGQTIPAELRVEGAGTYPATDPNNGGMGGNFCLANRCDSINPLPAAGGLNVNPANGPDEVGTILASALGVAFRSRAQIRFPRGERTRVNISVVDLDGNVIGFVRSQDAPIFGADVSVQKARTATFFSSTTAAANLQAAVVAFPNARQPSQYVDDVRAFFGDPTALANGFAFSDRAGGNLSRPFFPDGDDSRPNGPLSRPLSQWSPFSTGLQLDAAVDGILAALGNPALLSCTDPNLNAVRNGFQIFPGSVPIFRGDTLIGGLGVSGDGVDQDDMVSFLGVHNAGLQLGTGVGNAPIARRADQILIPGFDLRLRFVNCPPTPFLGEDAGEVCDGK